MQNSTAILIAAAGAGNSRSNLNLTTATSEGVVNHSELSSLHTVAFGQGLDASVPKYDPSLILADHQPRLQHHRAPLPPLPPRPGNRTVAQSKVMPSLVAPLSIANAEQSKMNTHALPVELPQASVGDAHPVESTPVVPAAGMVHIPPVYYPQPIYPSPSTSQLRLPVAPSIAPTSLTVMHPNLVETLKTAIDLPATDTSRTGKPSGRPTAFHQPARLAESRPPAPQVQARVFHHNALDTVASQQQQQQAQPQQQHHQEQQPLLTPQPIVQQLESQHQFQEPSLVGQLMESARKRHRRGNETAAVSMPWVTVAPSNGTHFAINGKVSAGILSNGTQEHTGEGNGSNEVGVSIPPVSWDKAGIVGHEGSMASTAMTSIVVPEAYIKDRRPYTCDYMNCQKAFRNLQTLKMHRKTHSHTPDRNGVFHYKRLDMKPLHGDLKAGRNKKIPSSCPVCNDTFVGLYELRRHYGRKHSNGEKRFKCQKCDKAFFIDVDLRDHQKSCGQPIECLGCGQKFSFKCNLVGHRKAHPECRDAEKAASLSPSNKQQQQLLQRLDEKESERPEPETVVEARGSSESNGGVKVEIRTTQAERDVASQGTSSPLMGWAPAQQGVGGKEWGPWTMASPSDEAVGSSLTGNALAIPCGMGGGDLQDSLGVPFTYSNGLAHPPDGNVAISIHGSSTLRHDQDFVRVLAHVASNGQGDTTRPP